MSDPLISGSRSRSRAGSIARWSAACVGIAAGVYAGLVATSWKRYGRTTPPRGDEVDPLLDTFMMAPEVAERHSINVAAPVATTFAVACELDLFNMAVAQALFTMRGAIMGAKDEPQPQVRGLVKSAQSVGWGVLGEIPGREIILGAVTRPWEANVTFRAIAPEHFARFSEPDYVKIVWTLRADPIDASHSVFRTETRVATTDAASRRTFRRYWSFVAPGIVLIRWIALNPVKREAERRAAIHTPASSSTQDAPPRSDQ